MVKKVSHYFVSFIVRPAKAADELSSDPSSLWLGFFWVLFFCVCYSLTVLVAYLLGGKPSGGLLLPIPAKSWYLVQTFTTIPAGITGILAFGVHTPPWPQWIELLRVFILPFLWIFIISTVALIRITGLAWWKSLFVVIVSCIPAGMVMAIFIR